MRRCICSALAGITLAFGTPVASRADTSGTCDVRDPVPVALHSAGLTSFSDEPGAGRWRTWNVDLADYAIPPPPATGTPQQARELAEVQLASLSRTPELNEEARYWGEGAAGSAWTERFLSLIARHSADPGNSPPRISRQIAMFQTAALDALVVAWNAKYCYLRPAPSRLDPAIVPVVPPPDAPSYPSEHATVAGVASVLFRRFFPSEPATEIEDRALAAAASRVWAGTNYPSDVDAGYELGRAVARAVFAGRQDDGSSAVWDGSGRIEGTCNWAPTPPGFRYPPAEPMWGLVRPWLMSSSSQFRPPPPAACGSTEYLAAAEDLYRMSLGLTDRQKAVADYWAGGPGTETPPGMNLRLAMETADRRGLGTMRHARVMSYVGAALADAAIAAWDAKYVYWWDRPVQTIRRLWDAGWSSYIGTPPFPGYISGHSTFSGAGSEVLSYFFPEDAIALRAMASEAALSRFYGGIHVRYDNDVGLEVGARIARVAAERAANDRA